MSLAAVGGFDRERVELETEGLCAAEQDGS